MKNFIKIHLSVLLIVLLGITSWQEGVAQGNSEWRVGVRALTVTHSGFNEGWDFGGGIFVNNRRDVFKRFQLKWNNEFGIDGLLPCNRPEGCRSWWYQRNIRYYSGLEKNFVLGGQDFSVGLGFNFFYGSKMNMRIESEYRDYVNNIYTKTVTKYYQPDFIYLLPGARIGYSNQKISEKITFYLGYDYVWNNHLTTLSMSYRIRD